MECRVSYGRRGRGYLLDGYDYGVGLPDLQPRPRSFPDEPDWPLVDGEFEGLGMSAIPDVDLYRMIQQGMDSCGDQRRAVNELRARGLTPPPMQGSCGWEGYDVDAPVARHNAYVPPTVGYGGDSFGSRAGGGTTSFGGPAGGGSPPPPLEVPQDRLSKIRKEMALKYHPDRAGGSDEVMRAVNSTLDRVAEEAKKK